MNTEMAYLLGMICRNGEIQRSSTDTIVSIDIPHKKLETEGCNYKIVFYRSQKKQLNFERFRTIMVIL